MIVHMLKRESYTEQSTAVCVWRHEREKRVRDEKRNNSLCSGSSLLIFIIKKAYIIRNEYSTNLSRATNLE
jgi:hypothetical protein